MVRVGRLAAVGVLAAALVGGAAFGWSSPRVPCREDGAAEPPAPAEAGPPAQVVPPPVAAPAPPVPVLSAPQPAADARVNEPAVRLTWAAPADARVNRAAPYLLRVENTSGQAVQKVVVQVRVPAGVTASDTDPAARTVGGVLLWELGTLQVRDARELRMNLASPARGELTAQAWVTFTGTASTAVTVREPKLEAFIVAPEAAEVGGRVPVKYGVRNVGDSRAEGLAVKLTSSYSWSPFQQVLGGPEVLGGPAANGPGVTLEPGKEYVGEVNELPDARGVITLRLDATAADGLAATKTATVKVLSPKLEVAIAGPAELALNKAAEYKVTVKNAGDLTAEDVAVVTELPEGVRHTGTCTTCPDLDVPVRHAAVNPLTAVRLKPGESATLTVRGTAVRPGEYAPRVTATERRGGKAAAECRTVVRGVPGIRMEVADGVDPVEKGKETVYEIRVSNTGTETDRNLKLVCHVPDGMEVLSVTGPVPFRERLGVDQAGAPARVSTVTFDPVRELGPKTEVVFKVVVRAGKAGAARFAASITSDHLTAPVSKEESTTVYGE